jgi:gluconate 2-dehydrogenase gamma chain
MMNRRDAIKNSVAVAGFALSASALSSFLQSCSVDKTEGWVPVFFSKDQVAFISSIADTILPDTEDSPGAASVQVERFIDLIAAELVNRDTANAILERLNQFMAETNTAFGKSFVSGTAQEKLDYLAKVNLLEIEKSNGDPAYKSSFLELKEMVIQVYFSTEEIAKNLLVFDPVPGIYKGCVPLTEATGGKMWAL